MESSDQSRTTSPHHVQKQDAATTSDEDDLHPATSPSLKPPPNQEMERSPSAYRIPASVFERNKSSTADWSTASNESLFSIHMGNMSFANDNIWKSGDLGPPTEAAPRPSTSEQMFSYPGNTGGGGAADVMRSRELGLAEATMLEVIKENEGRSQSSPASELRTAHRPTGSNQSNMSFAFSVKGGDADRIPSSVKPSQPARKSEAETEGEGEGGPETKEKGDQDQTQTQPKWCFCFPCCSFWP